MILDGGIGMEDIVLGDELAPAAASELLVVDTGAGADAVLDAIAEARRRCARAWVACAVFSSRARVEGPCGAVDSRPGGGAGGDGRGQRGRLDPVFESPYRKRGRSSITNRVDAREAPASQRAAIDFLRGSLPSLGRLPVRLH